MSYSKGIGTDDPLTTAKRRVEQAVKESGMSYTILKPTCFMEVWLGPTIGFDYPNAKATIYGNGEKRLSWIATTDVAQFAVASLNNPAAENAELELGGPEALSPVEVVRIFEQIGGRPFELQYVPEEALRVQGESATDSLQKAFTALMLGYAQGNEIDMTDTLKQFPVHLTSVREYASRSLAQS